MSIKQFIKQRGIESVVHFTTNRGSLGIFACNALKSRQRLNADEQLKHIFQPNARYRDKDLAWLDYANLSISRINMNFFNTCSGSWHRERDFFGAFSISNRKSCFMTMCSSPPRTTFIPVI
ncbi:hypothetical protein P4197_03525 [Pseudomonas aeruginosa]|uniref:hypothetical protein n=1 Tax=Pseudomonas aeruginosa TaxID=287 RepID=UPI0022B40E24|nr:hypothetical protein [Pseudomonas aeruginosa]MDF5857589.1 hypothetical protein [Pseudomonas aeruginosa]MDF5922767.1 hypothetical protein [Pseudomonas aeruginosa]WBA39623.1 hypothetical protein O4M85_20880 [Pseudomonas aeruginosa]